ncbi:uncharacterized protein, partial [Temnothorax longispinosus]|uniref:uncharacterized protein n=1 Tax=Temnothorax longispinosus TaxID=300112 RepID=UPI003A98DE08
RVVACQIVITAKRIYNETFSKNPARRALWAACISRLNWTPTDNTYICEVHFLDDMWETTRVDSKKKLKLNAIPTLFPNYVVKRESLVEEKDENENKNECEAIDVADDENKNKNEYEATNVAEDKNEYEATNVAEDENEHEAMNVIEDENKITRKEIKRKKQDDSRMITEFLNNSNSTKKQSISEECNDNELFSPIPHSNTIVFNNIELNVLYNIAGYIIANIKKNMTHCDNCISSVGSKKVQNVKYNNLVLLRRYKIETLFFVKPNIFDFFVKMETIFRNCFPHIKNKNKNLKQYFITQFSQIDCNILDCHNLKYKIIFKYTIFRLRIANKKKVLKRRSYNSKTMAMHCNLK